MSSTSLLKLIQQRKIGGPESFEMEAHKSIVSRLCKSHYLEKHTGCINTISWNEDGSKLVSGSDDRTVIIWGKWPLEEMVTIPSGHRNNVFCATFVPGSNDESLVTSAADGCVHLLNVASGQRDKLYECETNAYCFKHCFDLLNPTAIGFATLSNGVVVRFDVRAKSADRIMNVSLDRFLRRAADGRFASPPSGTAVAINPIDPYMLALGTSTKMVQLFDVRSLAKPVARIYPEFVSRAHGGWGAEAEVAVSGLCWDQRNRLIVNFCRQPVIEIDISHIGTSHGPDRHLVGSHAIPRQWSGRVNHQTFLKEVALIGGGNFVATGGDCGSLFIWERFGSQKLIFKKPADPYVLNCVAPHPYLPVVATSGIASVADIWEPISEDPQVDVSSISEDTTHESYSDESADVLRGEISRREALHRMAEATALQELGDNLVDSGDISAAVVKYEMACSKLEYECSVEPLMEQRSALLERVLTDKAAALMVLSRFDEARDACSEALELDPSSFRALIRRSKCFIRLGELDAARDDLLDAQWLSPSDPEVVQLTRQLEP